MLNFQYIFNKKFREIFFIGDSSSSEEGEEEDEDVETQVNCNKPESSDDDSLTGR